jgi:hypothetical protein
MIGKISFANIKQLFVQQGVPDSHGGQSRGTVPLLFSLQQA